MTNQPKNSDFPKNWGKIVEPQPQTDWIEEKIEEGRRLFDFGKASAGRHTSVSAWLRQSFRDQQSLHEAELERARGGIEGLRKVHKEFECSGSGGHYESFCTDPNCSAAPKEYNQAIDDIIQIMKKK